DTGRTVATHSSAGEIKTIIFSPGSNELAFGDDKGIFEVWPVPKGPRKLSFLHREQVTDAAYAQSGLSRYIVTSSTDRSLRILDELFSSWRIAEFRFDYALWQLAVDPSGQLIAVARGDGYVDIWNRGEERIVGRVRIESSDAPTGIAFLPGNVLAVVDGG